MTATTLDPCPDMIPLLGAHALGALEPEAAARLDAHLEGGCAGCRALRDELEAELDAARLPEEDPAPGGWERVLVRLDGAAPGAASPPAVRLRCAYCHDDLRRAEAACCAACLAPHHPDCFAEHGRCAAPGCQETRTLRASEPTGAVAPAPSRRRGGLGRARGGAVWAVGLACGVGGMAAWSQWRTSSVTSASYSSQGGASEGRVPSARDLTPFVRSDPQPTYGGLTLPQWIERLGDHSPEFRDEASRALVSIGDEALQPLFEAMSSPTATRRQGVLETVFLYPDAEPGRMPELCARILLLGLRDASSAVRLQAALTLSNDLDRIGKRREEAVSVLEDLARTDADEGVRLRAALTLEQVAAERPAALDAMASALESDPSPQVRLGLVHPVGQVAPPTTRSVTALVHALREDSQATVRRAAADALGWSDLHEALIPTVCQALAATLRSETELDVREMAAIRMLCYPPEQRDLEALLTASANTPSALQALGYLPPDQLARFLHDLERRPEREQAMGLQAIAGVPDDGAAGLALVPVLIRYLEHTTDSGRRADAARQLWRHAGLARCAGTEAQLAGLPGGLQQDALLAVTSAVPDLTAALARAPSVGDAQLLGLLRQRAVEATATLAELSRSGPSTIRAAALEALGNVAPQRPETLAALQLGLRSSLREEQVLLTSLRTTQRLGPAAASLRQEVAAHLDADLHEWRLLALRALQDMQLDGSTLREVEPQLTSMAQHDPDPRLKKLAQELLARLDPAEPVKGPGEPGR